MSDDWHPPKAWDNDPYHYERWRGHPETWGIDKQSFLWSFMGVIEKGICRYAHNAGVSSDTLTGKSSGKKTTRMG